MSRGEIGNGAYQTNLVRRLRSAEGHLRGVAAMVERGGDCESILHQVLAVQAALVQIQRLILRHHLAECLGQEFPEAAIDPAASERWVAEVISLYELNRQVRSHSKRIITGD